MSRTFLTRSSVGLLFLLVSWMAFTQDKPPELTIEKVKDNLHVIVGDGGNVAVYVTGYGVILVDDKFERDFEPIMEKVESVTDESVEYVFTTHHHGDHSGGNVKFLPTAQIISTANARKHIVERMRTNESDNVTPAQIVFTTESSVFLGGKEVRAMHFGRGHTNGDAIIYFPELRTIHTGDLMAGTTPFIDYAGGGSVVEFTRTLDEALKLDFDTVIPGHGAVTNKAGLRTYRDNIEKLRTRATSLIREGKSQDEVGKTMIAEFGWSPTGLQMQRSLPGLMEELR